jgi:carboxylate-amine ligase
MAPRFTLGVEEEFQMVNKVTGQLVSHVHPILEQAEPILGEYVKAEMLQSMVEIITGVCPTTTTLRQDLQRKRNVIAQLLAEDGLALVSAGTHPSGHWMEQRRTNNTRYEVLEDEFQDVARSILICGLHVHVGIATHEIAIPLMNQLRTWLPHLLAFSSNSPFWNGRYTGLKSYRSIVWRRFPRSGVPNDFSSTSAFDDYVAHLIQTGCIDNAKRIWWDIRPHPFFSTIEFRICDMPATFEDTIAIAALCQALVAKLTWLYEHNLLTPTLSTHYIEENKWRAARYGMDAEIVDFTQNRSMPMRDSFHELLDFVDDVVDDLDTRREMHYIRSLLDDPRGTGADRQIAIYNATRDTQAVARYLIEQTAQAANSNSVATTS